MSDLLKEFEEAVKVFKDLYAKKKEAEITLNRIDQELFDMSKLIDTLIKKLGSAGGSLIFSSNAHYHTNVW